MTKVMRKKLFLSLAGCVSLLAISQTVTDETSRRLDTYQQQVRVQASGVYPIGEQLYVHVRLPMRMLDPLSKTKLKATLKAKELLQDWAIEQTADARTKAMAGLPEGMKIAARVLDEAVPKWRFTDWKFDFKGQEIGGKDKTEYCLGWIVDTEDVARCIPESFSLALPPDEQVYQQLRQYVPRMLKADTLRFYGTCGVVDVRGVTNSEEAVMSEYAAVQAKIDKYLRESPFVKGFRERAEKLRVPSVSEVWDEMPGMVFGEPREILSVVTNTLTEIKVVTNSIVRVATSEERGILGVAEKGLVTQTDVSFEEEEIVETKTVTTATRKIRCRVQRSVVGNPRFEELFLAGGKIANQASPQMVSGEMAAKGYLQETVDFDASEHMVEEALCENPGDSQLWNIYGECRAKRNDIYGALISFRNALVIEPTDLATLMNLMRTYQTLGCRRLANGLAVLVCGTSDQKWCVEEAQQILHTKKGCEDKQ